MTVTTAAADQTGVVECEYDAKGQAQWELDDNRLRQLRAMDRNALAVVYDNYHEPIYRYIYRRVGDVETSADLTADVFRNLLQAISRNQCPQRSILAWLYRVAHNTVVDYYRRQKYRCHAGLDETSLIAAEDPVHSAEQRILATEIRRALQFLTDEQQQVIALKFLQGLNNDEVALILDKSVGAVKALQHRGLAALRRQLESIGEEAPK